MTWDYTEANPLAGAAGDLSTSVEATARVVDMLVGSVESFVDQANAVSLDWRGLVLCTDPPYYDNIGYADLSDFFYVWLRRSLRDVYPELLGTVLTPKTDELIASPFRFDGDEQKAQDHFESGFGKVFAHAAHHALADTPMTVFYAFKQSETEDEPAASSYRDRLDWVGKNAGGVAPVRSPGHRDGAHANGTFGPQHRNWD